MKNFATIIIVCLYLLQLQSCVKDCHEGSIPFCAKTLKNIHIDRDTVLAIQKVVDYEESNPIVYSIADSIAFEHEQGIHNLEMKTSLRTVPSFSIWGNCTKKHLRISTSIRGENKEYNKTPYFSITWASANQIPKFPKSFEFKYLGTTYSHPYKGNREDPVADSLSYERTYNDYEFNSTTYKNCLFLDIIYQDSAIVSTIYSPDHGFLYYRHRNDVYHRKI